MFFCISNGDRKVGSDKFPLMAEHLCLRRGQQGAFCPGVVELEPMCYLQGLIKCQQHDGFFGLQL